MSELSLPPVRTWLTAPMKRDVSEAIERLRRAPDVQRVAVMPDVHLATDVCIGVVVATSERRRGASRRSAPSASVTARSGGMTTCTNRCPQSGAAETSSTNRSFTPSSAWRSASARLSAR